MPDSPADLAVPGVSGPVGDGSQPVVSARRSRMMLPRADRREIAAIFAGGALGTLLRAALAEAFPHPPTAWPWPTFAVNIVAAFLLGYFVTRLQERLPLSSYRRPLLGTGLCGGLSTFSTMQVEILKMLSAHAWVLAAGNGLFLAPQVAATRPRSTASTSPSRSASSSTISAWACAN